MAFQRNDEKRAPRLPNRIIILIDQPERVLIGSPVPVETGSDRFRLQPLDDKRVLDIPRSSIINMIDPYNASLQEVAERTPWDALAAPSTGEREELTGTLRHRPLRTFLVHQRSRPRLFVAHQDSIPPYEGEDDYPADDQVMLNFRLVGLGQDVQVRLDDILEVYNDMGDLLWTRLNRA